MKSSRFFEISFLGLLLLSIIMSAVFSMTSMIVFGIIALVFVLALTFSIVIAFVFPKAGHYMFEWHVPDSNYEKKRNFDKFPLQILWQENF